jgi:hypothetical protein
MALSIDSNHLKRKIQNDLEVAKMLARKDMERIHKEQSNRKKRKRATRRREMTFMEPSAGQFLSSLEDQIDDESSLRSRNMDNNETICFRIPKLIEFCQVCAKRSMDNPKSHNKQHT